ncbi:LysR family transcriptional regulator [Alkalihalobacillus sp. MEB130]|uniref:LysR family transcriptional regulator n=1 Tax=Alkalihalobacillus sp. MEB130 TaxID=2976704 RepID=UPI0028E04671|nr:LysR family transcriptional regulator [Alkalihalobacillus sp. MEB130]MDT8862975.1 LysR family transcriptional regulator [Alkalihalobacillus sp. MEB130]
MNIEQLEYIVEVAKTNSVSIASQNLHVSQSAISQSISRFELEFGVKIFKRSRLGTHPTKEGRRVIKKAYEILLKINELEQDTKIHKKQLTGNLRVSVTPNMMLVIFETLAAFKKEQPYVNIEILEKGSYNILEDLKQKKTDIGLLNINNELLNSDGHFDFEKLVYGRVTVFVGKKHPLSVKDTLTTDEIVQNPLVLFKSTYISRIVDKLANKYNKLNILFTSDSNDLIKKAITEGMGIGIGTDHMIKFDPHIINGEIITLNIIDFEDKEDLYFGWTKLKGAPVSPAAKVFIHHLKSQIDYKGIGL